MRWPGKRKKAVRETESAEHLLSRFGLTASVNDALRIRPVGPVLCYEELDMILKRLVFERVDQRVPEIVLDFGTIERIDALWAAVVARLIDFARSSKARFRLAALHGQPAWVIDFFGQSHAVRSLLNPDHLAGGWGTATVRRASA